MFILFLSSFMLYIFFYPPYNNYLRRCRCCFCCILFIFLLSVFYVKRFRILVSQNNTATYVNKPFFPPHFLYDMMEPKNLIPPPTYIRIYLSRIIHSSCSLRVECILQLLSTGTQLTLVYLREHYRNAFYIRNLAMEKTSPLISKHFSRPFLFLKWVC